MSKKESRLDPRDRSMDEEEKKQKEEYPVDPYTGEPEPPAEDAGKVIELVPTDTGSRSGENYLLEEETALDKVALDNQSDAVVDRMNRYTEDEEIESDFEERQKLASGGRMQIEQKLDEYHAEDPDLSAGDLDAAWDDAIVAGEEGVGGSVATPDQDIVDELGEGLGVTYEEDEVLQGREKLRQRDRNRWELDPKSAENLNEGEED